MADIEIFGLEIENIEIIALLTLIGWITMYVVFKYWMKTVPDYNFWGFFIICMVLCPVASYLIAQWQSNKD